MQGLPWLQLFVYVTDEHDRCSTYCDYFSASQQLVGTVSNCFPIIDTLAVL